VRDHRGWIEVSTRPDEGSTFTIGLPALPAPPTVVENPDRDGLLVLVANPDRYVRDLISGALVAEGHRTLSASTIGEIRAGFAGHRSVVDLAVIDSRLLLGDSPDSPCVPPDVPVILTGEPASAVDLDGRTGVRVLGEPLSLAALTQSVASLLRPSDLLVPS